MSSSISNALSCLPSRSANCHNGVREFRAGNVANMEVLLFGKCRLSWSSQNTCVFRAKAVGDSTNSTGSEQVKDGVDFGTKASDSDRRVGALSVMITSMPSFVAMVKKNAGSKFAIAELVRRGQLRSNRRGISNPLKYEDPFNNPQVKIEKNNSKVEMCGKVYRLAPVTLTQEEQLIHQRRRSRAYQWKRPTIFLKEGDPVPPDVDPDTVRWIPDNHPFATTATELDESLAQSNVFQKDGVPFRVRAEHEALQKKLENLQTAQTEMGIKQNNVLERERLAERSTGRNDKVEPDLSPEHGKPNLDSTGSR